MGEIRIPPLSPGIEAVSLARWLKNVGDNIEIGDVVAEVETDKATMEVEAYEAGILAEILIAADTSDVPVDAIIARLSSEVDQSRSTEDFAPSEAVATAAPESQPARPAASSRIFASPLAKRLARTNGITLDKLQGTGPHGRIIAKDIASPSIGLRDKSSEARRGSTAAPVFAADSSSPQVIDSQPTPHYAPMQSTELLPFSQLTVSAECQVDALLALLVKVNVALAARLPMVETSLDDWCVKALAKALTDVSGAKVAGAETALSPPFPADVSMAVMTSTGMIGLVIRDADAKSVSSIASEAATQMRSAREGALLSVDGQAAGVSLLNLGTYGAEEVVPTIEPPQAMSLAIGAVQVRIVPVDGQAMVAKVMKCSISVDRRHIDPVSAAKTIATFKYTIEHPLLLLA